MEIETYINKQKQYDSWDMYTNAIQECNYKWQTHPCLASFAGESCFIGYMHM